MVGSRFRLFPHARINWCAILSDSYTENKAQVDYRLTLCLLHVQCQISRKIPRSSENYRRVIFYDFIATQINANSVGKTKIIINTHAKNVSPWGLLAPQLGQLSALVDTRFPHSLHLTKAIVLPCHPVSWAKDQHPSRLKDLRNIWHRT